MDDKKRKIEETKFMSDYPWGYKMGFECEDKVKNAREILKTLGYSNDAFIEEWRDLSKEQLHSKLGKLKEEAFDYELEHKEKDTKFCQVYTIIYVGARVDPIFHMKSLKPIKDKFKNLDKNYEEFYELTNDGKAINLNEYCAWIADTRYKESYSELTAAQ